MSTTSKVKKKTRATRRRKKDTDIDLVRLEKSKGKLEIDGDRLMVRISRDSHPDLYEIDRLSKHMQELIKTYGPQRNMRHLVDFLAETDKSLQIILRNHLEAAMRKYLG